MSRLCIFLVLICVLGGAKAQAIRPPAGENVDVSRRIRLLANAPAPCVSIAKGEATILLSRPELQDLARDGKKRGSSESDRLAFIQGQRASELLASLGDAHDSRGCAAAGKETTAETDYLLVDLLEGGNAYVIATATGAYVPEIAIRYLGRICGALCGRGDIMFSLPGSSSPFMRSSWWVS